MSAPTTAPGVYVQELPSGSRAITGVATSLTAFIGAARRGPVDTPVKITNLTQFESRFGALWNRSVLGQSVRHYFLNGGAEALIVRVVNNDSMVLTATAAVAAVGGFHHLVVTVSNTANRTFDLKIDAVAADGAMLTTAAGPMTDTVSVDLAADPAGTINGAGFDGIALVEVVGEPVTDPPPEGSSASSAGTAGAQVVTLGRRAQTARASVGVGLMLRVTAAARALAGFDRVQATVANSNTATGTFDLTISAVDGAGAVLEDAGAAFTVSLVGLHAGTDDVATINAARTATPTPIALVEVVGTAPTAVAPNGTSTSTALPDGSLVSTVTSTMLQLAAASPGGWGNALRAQVSTDEAPSGTFHLTLTEVDDAGAILASEVYYGVSADPLASRFLGRVLELQSQLAVLDAAGTPPAPAGAAPGQIVFGGGDDGGEPRITEDVTGSDLDRTGMHALVEADMFNLLCLPLAEWSNQDAGHLALWTAAAAFCEHHRAFLLIDPPLEWATAAAAVAGADSFAPRSNNAALYVPRVRMPDPLREGRLGEFPPCGVVAGVLARTDGQRGIWKAPAGIDAGLRGVPELTLRLSDTEHGDLNRLGVNVLRSFPVYGRVIWGARTLNGADVQSSEWKYVPVRRLALYLEESLLRGSRWAVFEPNGPDLWGQLRLSIGSFMHQLFRQGAFAGASASEAYLVACDAETTTQSDIDRGVVNVIVGFAPLKPAEFVIIRLQQLAAQAGQ